MMARSMRSKIMKVLQAESKVLEANSHTHMQKYKINAKMCTKYQNDNTWSAEQKNERFECRTKKLTNE